MDNVGGFKDVEETVSSANYGARRLLNVVDTLETSLLSRMLVQTPTMKFLTASALDQKRSMVKARLTHKHSNVMLVLLIGMIVSMMISRKYIQLTS